MKTTIKFMIATAALLSMAANMMAQEPANDLEVIPTDNPNEWILPIMPASNVVLEIEYQDLILENDADDENVLEELKYYETNATLKDRTFAGNGQWNTLCLPFGIKDFNGTPLQGATVKMLETSDFDNETGTLTLNFKDVESIETGRPYIVKWEGDARENLVFNNVNIYALSRSTITQYVDFVGSFSPVNLKANDKTVLFMGSGSTLYYPNADMTVGSCRALFYLKDITAGDPATVQGVKIVMNFGVDGTTGIVNMESKDAADKEEAWYTVDGRRLSGKPTANGIYIKNGKKMVIK